MTRCSDCSKPTFLYSLHDDVWLQAWPTYKEEKTQAEAIYGKFVTTMHGGKQLNPLCCLCLCIPCLEKRLGRPLTIDDFDDSPANDPIRFGLSLATMKPSCSFCGKPANPNLPISLLSPQQRADNQAWANSFKNDWHTGHCPHLELPSYACQPCYDSHPDAHLPKPA